MTDFAVKDSHEFRRIAALPRRTIDLATAEACAAELTPLLRRPGSRAELRPWQGLCLWELMSAGGLVAWLPVGQGKTLISLLAALVMRAKRPILCLPAGLREKTLADFAALAREWRLPDPPPVIVPYESLTQVGNVDYLDQIQPDMIIRDESHRTRNLERSAAKRIDRYVRKHKPINVGMTGSPGRLSILDYAHDLIWCLDDGAPVPLVKGEREMWAAALDERDPRMGDRPDPGPLGPDLDSAREWYRQRLVSTPGVVVVDEDSCDQPLTIRTVYAPEDPALDAAFERFRKTWTTPDDWPMSDAFSVFRHAAELGTGMYLRWDPRPPEWWATPRKVFCGFVRDRIRETARARRPLDTELAVRQAHPDAPEVTEWMAVRDGHGPNGEPPFRPNSVPVWVSGSVVRAALEWLRSSPLPGLVWCGNTAFGEVLAQQAGLRYYGPEGRALDGTSIMHIPGADNRDRDGRVGCGAACSAVLSVAANMQGRNLQGWSRALVINPPQSGMYLEQVIGRTHRSDQTRPVTIDVLVTSGDVADAFDAAWREATFGARTASLTQKILRARVERGQIALTEANQWRWARRSS